MNFTILRAYFILDLKVNFREKISILMLLLMPAVFYLFFGSFYSTPNDANGGVNFYNDYTVSFASVILLSIALMNIGPMIVICKEGGFFRRLFVTPLNMSEVWFSSILRALIIFLVGYVEMLLLGYFMFDQTPPTTYIQLLLPCLISAFALFSMGFLIGAMFNTSMAAFNAGMIIFQPMLLLSGAGFPLELFPDWARIMSAFIPFTYVVEIMRMGWVGELFTYQAIFPTVVLLIMGTSCAVIATTMFRRQML